MITKAKKTLISLFTPTSELSYSNRFTGAVCLVVMALNFMMLYNASQTGNLQSLLSAEDFSFKTGSDYLIVIVMISVGALVWMYNSEMDGYLHTSIIFGIMIIVLQLLFYSMGTYSLSFAYIIIILTIIYAKPVMTVIVGLVLLVSEGINYWTLVKIGESPEIFGKVVTITDDIKQNFLDSIVFYIPMTIIVAVFTSICIKRLFGFIRKYSNEQAVNESQKNAAAQIQQQIIENTHIDERAEDNIGFITFLKTADYVAGDFYDFYSIDRYHICFLVADVSGKGIAAGLFMVRAKEVLKVTARDKLDPARVMQRANDELCENNSECMFATVWLGIIDIRTGEVQYSNAGHPFPLFVGHNGCAIPLNEVSGPILGAFPGRKYKKSTVDLSEGDRLLLFTDGVSEQPISDEEMFGEKGLLEFVQKHTDTEDLCQAVFEEIKSFGEKQFDDITMLQLTMNQMKASTSKIGKEISRKCFLAAEPKSIRVFRKMLTDEFEGSLLDKTTINTFYVACEEIITNIIKYAYGSEHNNGGFEIILKSEDDYIDITFIDSGIAFNPFYIDASIRANREGDITEGGRGIKIFTDVMDEYTYKREDNLNIVSARKRV